MLYSLLIPKFVFKKVWKVLKITKRDWLRKNFLFRPLSHCSRSSTEVSHSVDSLSQFFLYSFIAKICHHGELKVWSFVMFAMMGSRQCQLPADACLPLRDITTVTDSWTFHVISLLMMIMTIHVSMSVHMLITFWAREVAAIVVWKRSRFWSMSS